MVECDTPETLDRVELAHAAARNDGEAVLELVKDAPEYCGWCFRKLRQYYPEIDADAVAYLEDDVDDPHNRLILTPAREYEPGIERDVVPPRIADGGRVIESSQPRRVCECGTVDIDLTDDRGTGGRLEAVERLGVVVRSVGAAFSDEAARRFVHAARKKGSGALTGKDDKVIARAVKLGLRYG